MLDLRSDLIASPRCRYWCDCWWLAHVCGAGTEPQAPPSAKVRGRDLPPRPAS